MPRYPMIDARGFVVGSIIVNDDVIPEALMQEEVEFKLGGSWIEPDDFQAFLLVPAEAEERHPVGDAIEAITHLMHVYEHRLYPLDQDVLDRAMETLKALDQAGFK